MRLKVSIIRTRENFGVRGDLASHGVPAPLSKEDREDGSSKALPRPEHLGENSRLFWGWPWSLAAAMGIPPGSASLPDRPRSRAS